ncbi:hypothetical protein [Streptomyces sp. NPDC005795]|uniref:hypothetical protein n=1 Tax=Streptomyces sp. NPDC005795 TaxID=3154677 RepID=UPI0033E1812F
MKESAAPGLTPAESTRLPALVIGPGQQLVVGLGAPTFCDSSGITVLIAAPAAADRMQPGL